MGSWSGILSFRAELPGFVVQVCCAHRFGQDCSVSVERGPWASLSVTCLLREIVRGYRLCGKWQSWLSYGFVLCDNGGLSWWVCPTWQCAFILGRLSSEGTIQSPNWRSHLLADVCVYVHTHTPYTGAHCSSVLRAWILESDIIIQVLF